MDPLGKLIRSGTITFDKFWAETVTLYPFVFNTQPEASLDDLEDGPWDELKTIFADIVVNDGTIMNTRVKAYNIIYTLSTSSTYPTEQVYYHVRQLINGHVRMVLLNIPPLLSETLEKTFHSIGNQVSKIHNLTNAFVPITSYLNRYWIPRYAEIPFKLACPLLLNANLDFCFSKQLIFSCWKWFRELYLIFPTEVLVVFIETWDVIIFFNIQLLKIEISESEIEKIIEARNNYSPPKVPKKKRKERNQLKTQK